MTPQINPQFVARALAAQGRNGDTELVHMSKQEVASLQALAQKHGIASLTRNPKTGLVEAGWLNSILPAVAGIGLATFAPELLPAMAGELGLGADAIASAGSVGSFLGSGVGAGLAVGGADALATGSLKQGLMAGLGAYGGATMAGTGVDNIFGGGTPVSASSTVANGADTAAAQGAQGAQGIASINQATDAAMSNNAANISNYADSQIAAGGSNGIASAGISPQQMASINGDTAAAYGNNATGISNYADSQIAAGATPNSVPGIAGQSPLSKLAYNSAQGPFDTANYNRLFNTAAMAAPSLGATPTAAQPTAIQNLENTVRPYTFTQTPNFAPGTAGNAATPYFTQQFTALPTFVAGQQPSTLPTHNLAGGGLAKGPAKGETLRGTLGTLHGVEKLTTYAGGGIASLGHYSDGGRLLRGPGDGVSDSIPAQIGQHQPARLAEGEFVVPARIVSELGNGSTNAGAKRLYAMLDRIQEGRKKTINGKTSYANDTKPEKHLPA